jgi:cell division protein FtsW (lipid II flippase)
MIIVSLIDYNFICKYYMVLYAANIVLLGLVLVVGSGADSHGASRWFQISDSFTIQPSEFAKIILIICTAVFLEKHADDLNTAKTLLKLAAFLAIPIGLIFAEPDLSTTILSISPIKDMARIIRNCFKYFIFFVFLLYIYHAHMEQRFTTLVYMPVYSLRMSGLFHKKGGSIHRYNYSVYSNHPLTL